MHTITHPYVVKQFMAHTADYGQARYKQMILQCSEILFFFETAVYGTLTVAIDNPCLAYAATKHMLQLQNMTTETKT